MTPTPWITGSCRDTHAGRSCPDSRRRAGRTAPATRPGLCLCGYGSPPYNLGHHHERARGRKRRWQGQYPGFADKLSAGEYVSYHRAVLSEMLRVLRNDGLVWYVHRRRPEIAGRTEAALLDQVIDGYPVRSEIIWHKPGGGVFNLPHRGDGGPVCYPAVKGTRPSF